MGLFTDRLNIILSDLISPNDQDIAKSRYKLGWSIDKKKTCEAQKAIENIFDHVPTKSNKFGFLLYFCRAALGLLLNLKGWIHDFNYYW